MRWAAIAALCTMTFAVAVADAERAVRVTTDARVDSITVGERFDVRYRATFPDSLTVLPAETVELGNCRLVSFLWSDDSRDGERIREGRLIALTLDLQQAYVPAFPLNFLTPAGDTVTVLTEDVYVPVRQMVAAEQADPRPLKPQWESPRSYFWWVVGGAAAVLLALALWWWRRRPREKADAPAVPELPADFVALRALAEIEEMELLEAGEFKQYYSRVTDVLRGYLERRYGFLAMEETTDEILGELDRRSIRVDGAEALLKEADLVKFAKFVPDAAAGRRAIEAARDIVVRTAPRPMPRPDAKAPAAVGE